MDSGYTISLVKNTLKRIQDEYCRYAVDVHRLELMYLIYNHNCKDCILHKVLRMNLYS